MSDPVPHAGARAANHVRDQSGAVIWDSTWPHCYSCGKQSPDVASLVYVRADGVRGMSYPDCANCRAHNARRLERLGFTINARTL